MRKLKIYFKSKEFLICFFIMLILVLIPMLKYIFLSSKLTYFPDMLNRFSFWRSSMFYSSGGLIMFLSPFIISILALSSFYYKVRGSYLKDVLLREKYKKVISKEIILSYIKVYLPFVSISLLVFFVGCFLYPAEVKNFEYADLYTEFNYIGNFGPYVYYTLCQIALLLYVIMITNISFIVLRVTRKITVSLILTFALVNALNFLIGNLGTIIKDILGNNFITDHLINFNIYEGYMIQTSVMNAIINMGILAIISLITVYLLYKNKERLVVDFD